MPSTRSLASADHPDFVVEWQLGGESSSVIDLTVARREPVGAGDGPGLLIPEARTREIRTSSTR